MVLNGRDYAAEQKELDDYIDALPSKEGKLIAVLHKAQDVFGFLPKELQNHVAEKLEVPAAKVYGVVTFYSFFNMKKKGEFKVSLCLGTACYVRGADDVLEEFRRDLNIEVGETSPDGAFSLDVVRCVGACGLAPVVTVNGKVYGRVKKEDVKKIIDDVMAGGANK